MINLSEAELEIMKNDLLKQLSELTSELEKDYPLIVKEAIEFKITVIIQAINNIQEAIGVSFQ